jgi:hypothetical protein
MSRERVEMAERAGVDELEQGVHGGTPMDDK